MGAADEAAAEAEAPADLAEEAPAEALAESDPEAEADDAALIGRHEMDDRFITGSAMAVWVRDTHEEEAPKAGRVVDSTAEVDSTVTVEVPCSTVMYHPATVDKQKAPSGGGKGRNIKVGRTRSLKTGGRDIRREVEGGDL